MTVRFLGGPFDGYERQGIALLELPEELWLRRARRYGDPDVAVTYDPRPGATRYRQIESGEDGWLYDCVPTINPAAYLEQLEAAEA